MIKQRDSAKRFFIALEEVYGPSSSGLSLLINVYVNTVLTDSDQIQQRWEKHFCNVLNGPSLLLLFLNLSLTLPGSPKFG